MLQVFSIGQRDGRVIVSTRDGSDLGPEVVVEREDTPTLLQVTMAAIEYEGDTEKIEAMRAVCAMAISVE